MTTIAWDGRQLAADRMASGAGACSGVTKIRKTHDGRLIGVSGKIARGMTFLDWLENKKGDIPDFQKTDQWVNAIEILQDGTIVEWECEGKSTVLDPFYAIGSGRDYAVATMYLGHDAQRAIQVASVFDPATGIGMDVLTLD